MKKLMILGGTRYTIPVIKTAHKLGYYVITADYCPNNVAHKYSDEYCNVSIIDKDSVLEVATKLKIDGIMSFGCDPGVLTAAYVAEKLCLPSVGSYESVSILQNKGKFRKFLRNNNFNVPTSKSYVDKCMALSDTDKFHWPVIVKPTDSAGSKGVSRVDDPRELLNAIDFALKYSHCKEFIIEDFLEKQGCSSDSDCFSVYGELKFVSFNSQLFDIESKNQYVPSAYTWPSTFTVAQEKELHSELQRLINLLGLKTSLYNVESRVCTDGKAYIMECSPRGGGNRLSELLKYATGVDLIKASVLAAVGEPITEVKQNKYYGNWAETILHSYKDGIFEDISIDKSILGYVVEKDLWVKSGDYVSCFNGANDSIGTLVFKFDDDCTMKKVINNIGNYVKVKLKKCDTINR